MHRWDFRRIFLPEILQFFIMLNCCYLIITQQQFIYYRTCIYIAGNSCNFSLSHNETSSCVENQRVDKIQALSSYYYLISTILASAPTIFTSLLLGPISDLIGRKIAIYLPIICQIIYTILLLCINIFNLPPYIIPISSLITGIGGNFAVSIMALSAYIVDVTPEKYRTARIGLLEIFTTLGSCIANFTSGLILEAIGFSYFFVMSLSLSFCILIYTFIFRDSIDWRVYMKSNPSLKQSFKRIAKGAVRPFYLFCANRHPIKFVTLIVIFSFSLNALFGNFDLFIFYALGPPMCWPSHLIGYYFGFSYLASAVGIFIILPILVKFRISDYLLIILSSLDIILVYVLVGTFQSKLVLLIIVPLVGCFRFLVTPGLKSSLAGLIDPKDHGSLFAIISVETTSVNLIASSVYNSLYPTLRKVYPGLAFYLVACGGIVPIALATILYLHQRCCEKDSSNYQDVNIQDESKPLLHD